MARAKNLLKEAGVAGILPARTAAVPGAESSRIHQTRAGKMPSPRAGGTPATRSKDAAARIRLLVLDVDGVMTDGSVLLDADGRELKRFDVTDGAGIKYFMRSGRQVAILSGRSSPAVTARAVELGVTLIRQNAKDKLPAYRAILAAAGVSESQTAVMGDDLPDLPLMRRCGLAIAPANAAAEVIEAADVVTARRGGGGAVREAVEHILRAAGAWETIVQRYRKEATQ